MGLFDSIGKFLFGDKGEFETKTISRWTPEQQELFRRMARLTTRWWGRKTPEEMAYLQFLSGFEPWYKSQVEQLYSPEQVRTMLEQVYLPAWESSIKPKIEAAYAGPGFWGTARAEGIRRSLEGIEKEALGQSLIARQQALSNLLSLIPATKAELARLSSPFSQAYWAAAAQLLGYDPYYILGGMRQPQPGFLHSVAEGVGRALPMLFGI